MISWELLSCGYMTFVWFRKDLALRIVRDPVDAWDSSRYNT